MVAMQPVHQPVATRETSTTPLRLWRRSAYRVRQFIRQIISRPDPEVDSALSALLPDEQWALVRRLSPADRTHLLAIHRELVRQGWTDSDLLHAALLHDVGKADTDGRAGPLHRTIKVVLASIAPDLLNRLAVERGGWLGHGLYLSLHHATHGAERALTAGATERTCWLIAHHDDGRIAGDAALQALQGIDARV